MPEQASARPQRPSRNIDLVSFPELTWGTDAEVANSLASLYKHAEARAESTVAWYMRRKASKSRGSRTLRMLAIVLATLGGLAPILDATGLTEGLLPERTKIAEVGFLLLGLAAACVGVDKFFGLSSGWMRYITTAMEIQEDLSRLRMDWAAMSVRSRSRPLTTDDILRLLARLRQFLGALDGRVMQETRAWISEFQTNLAELDRAAADYRGRLVDRWGGGPGADQPALQPEPAARSRMPDTPVVDTSAEIPADRPAAPTAADPAAVPSAAPTDPA